MSNKSVSLFALRCCCVVIFAQISMTVAHAQITGLDFPGSATVSSTMRFKFTDPQDNGLPIYGPGGGGVTYIWRAYPRQQAGYYTTLFWGNDDGKNNLDTFLWTQSGGADSYYGAHPQPKNPPDGNTHDWEIAVERENPVNDIVVYDRWYTQALRVWSDASGKHHEFYSDLPNSDASVRVIRDSPTSWGNVKPPAPALTWGEAPWAPGEKVWNGILRGIQIYATRLTIDEILREATTPNSTASGRAAIEYMNINPTPSDISDQSGNGNHPSWVGNKRPGLFTENAGLVRPAAPTDLVAQQCK